MAGVAGEAAEKAVGKFGDFMEKLGKGEAFLGSNKPINKIGNNMVGGGEFLARMAGGTAPKQALNETFRHGGTSDGALNYGKIAGSYIGAAAAYRVMSGGGPYRDQNGNTNLIGVPFV